MDSVEWNAALICPRPAPANRRLRRTRARYSLTRHLLGNLRVVFGPKLGGGVFPVTADVYCLDSLMLPQWGQLFDAIFPSLVKIELFECSYR